MDKKKEFHNMKSSSLVTPLGFKPKTFRTFSGLIRLKKQYSFRPSSDSVGIQTQDLQNFFWPHSAKKAILFQAIK